MVSFMLEGRRITTVKKRHPEGEIEMASARDPKDPRPLEVFDQYRGLLFSVAYRMLGSAADAGDMVQESFIRWQQAPDTAIRSPRAFLVTIVTRLCINHLQSAGMQREEYIGQWLPEPLLTGPLDGGPSQFLQIDQSLSMTFLVLLVRLNPMERAVWQDSTQNVARSYGQDSTLAVNARQPRSQRVSNAFFEVNGAFLNDRLINTPTYSLLASSISPGIVGTRCPSMPRSSPFVIRLSSAGG
jgi:DNA-directed RNA polymerase specialized sigma24 family protein